MLASDPLAGRENTEHDVPYGKIRKPCLLFLFLACYR
jgi:hypothetical protein